MSDESIDEETGRSMRDAVASAGADAGKKMKWTAGAQLAILFGGTIALLLLSVVTGIVPVEITLVASVSVGWVIEYLIIGLSAAFLLYVFALIFTFMPGSMTTAIAALAFGIAKQQGFIEESDEEE
jgi:hypothetical protein